MLVCKVLEIYDRQNVPVWSGIIFYPLLTILTSFSELLYFCEEANKWMGGDEKKVLAIHCKGGKGKRIKCMIMKKYKV